MADYFKHNYGKKTAYFVSLITIFLMFGFLVINLIAGTKIFVFFTGWSFWLAAIVMIFVILFYILLGGFKAVVKTDILQYFSILFILGLLAFMLFNHSLIPVSEWNMFNADLGTIVGFFLVGILFPFAMPELWQRVYSSKNKKSLRKGMILSSVLYAFVGFLLGLIALTVKVKFPGVDPDLALIQGFANLLPPGILGLSTILLFAAVMSSIDTYIFTAASSTIQDFFDWDKRKTVRNIRKIILVLAVLATLISILIQDLVLGSYLFVSFVLVLGVVAMATWIKPSIKNTTIIGGLVVGLLGIILFITHSLVFGEGITPTVAVGGLGSTLLGLFLGGIYNYLTKRFK